MATEKDDALMVMIDDLATLTKDQAANPRIRQLVLRLGIFVGLEVEESRWGKRPIRRLSPGLLPGAVRLPPVPPQAREPGTTARMTPTPGWSRLIREQPSSVQKLVRTFPGWGRGLGAGYCPSTTAMMA